jgi:hypothetical protein
MGLGPSLICWKRLGGTTGTSSVVVVLVQLGLALVQVLVVKTEDLQVLVCIAQEYSIGASNDGTSTSP